MINNIFHISSVNVINLLLYNYYIINLLLYMTEF